jgi:hypothetical protein
VFIVINVVFIIVCVHACGSCENSSTVRFGAREGEEVTCTDSPD